MPLSPWFMPGFLLVHVVVLVSKSALKPTESGLTCSRCMPKGRKRVIAPYQPNGRCDLPSPAPSESGEEAEDGFIGSPGSERGRCVTNRFSLSLPFSLLGTTINLFLLADAAQTNGRRLGSSSSSDFPNQQFQSHVEAPCACVTSQHAGIARPNMYHTVSDSKIFHTPAETTSRFWLGVGILSSFL